MRWDSQRLDLDEPTTLPGMPSIRGLLRSVQVPGFPGLTFHEVRSKSALNRVPDESAMPFSWTINPYRGCSHSCVYCLAGDTQVLLADGDQRPISDVRAGDRIIGTEPRDTYRHYVETKVLARWSTEKPAHRLTLEDGTEIVASGDHRFLTGGGWKHVADVTSGRDRRPHLTTNDELLGYGRTVNALASCAEYRRGYLTGMVRGDANLKVYRYQRAGRTHADVCRFRLALADAEGLDRTQDYLDQEGISTDRFDFTGATGARRAITAIRTSSASSLARIGEIIVWPRQPTAAWNRGFLAGIFDAEGSRSNGILRISNTDTSILEHTHAALEGFGFDVVREDRRRPNGLISLRVRGGVREHMRFVHLVDPAIRRKCSVHGAAVKSDAALRVVGIEPLGLEMPMYDITTGTGDFIANGVISHNCFARQTHEWLELDSGRDFDSQIVVKTNLVDVLRKELARPSWQREHVALGTNTDPYQRAEGRYRLMPGVIRELTESGTPFSVLTKGSLVRRDLDLFRAAAEVVDVGVSVSVGSVDPALWRAVEPGTPSPWARLAVVRAFSRGGIGCGVLMAPVLPFLSDSDDQLDATVRAVAEAGASSLTALALHLRPGAREWWFTWLRAHRPDLVEPYERLYAGRAYAPTAYQRDLSERVATLVRLHGVGRHALRSSSPWRAGAAPRDAAAALVASGGEPPPAEQLTLAL